MKVIIKEQISIIDDGVVVEYFSLDVKLSVSGDAVQINDPRNSRPVDYVLPASDIASVDGVSFLGDAEALLAAMQEGINMSKAIAAYSLPTSLPSVENALGLTLTAGQMVYSHHDKALLFSPKGLGFADGGIVKSVAFEVMAPPVAVPLLVVDFNKTRMTGNQRSIADGTDYAALGDGMLRVFKFKKGDSGEVKEMSPRRQGVFALKSGHYAVASWHQYNVETKQGFDNWLVLARLVVDAENSTIGRVVGGVAISVVGRLKALTLAAVGSAKFNQSEYFIDTTPPNVTFEQALTVE